jgi:peptide/nickel transport system substrate-binding protein
MFTRYRVSGSVLAVLLVSAALVSACAGAPSTPAAPPAAAPTQAPPAPTQAPVAPTKPPAPTPTVAPAKGGSLIYGMYTKFDTLDPNVTTFSVVGIIGFELCDPLVWEPSAGNFVPGLAESWSVSTDGKEYTFKLRKDVKFHDGTPLNAQAVKFTFDRIVNPDTKSQTAFSLIGPYDSSEVVDDYTVKVKFKQPYAPFLDSISMPYLSPQSPAAVQAAGKDYGTTTIACTGP